MLHIHYENEIQWNSFHAQHNNAEHGNYIILYIHRITEYRINITLYRIRIKSTSYYIIIVHTCCCFSAQEIASKGG